jgi:hypothetical protein
MALRRSVGDDIFKLLEVICKKVHVDIDGCDSADIDDLAENPEPVFCMKRIRRMGLQNFLKTYVTKTISLLTIGDAHQSRGFFDLDNAGSRGMLLSSGGARKTGRRTRKMTRNKKSMTLRKTQRRRRRRMQKKRRTTRNR